MRKQIDLTTLPGWANLSSGNHTIKIKAKGTGYKESELSAGVTVSKAPSTVTLEKGTYKWVDNPDLIYLDFVSFSYSTVGVAYLGMSIAEDYILYSTHVFGTYGYFKVYESVSGKKPYWGYYDDDHKELNVENTVCQTITLATDQTVSAEFYKWAITDGNLVKQVEPVAYTDCLTFTGETSEFTLAVGTNGAKEWDGTLYYSTDHNTWNVWDGTAISSANKKLYLRGKNNTTFYTSKGARLSLSAKAECSGNIQTLHDYENLQTSIRANNCCRNMFHSCVNLITAPTLPDTAVGYGWYYNMFLGCTNLIIAPALPATSLGEWCYNNMFYNCVNLTVAPNLPATTLKEGCYYFMFAGCSKLKVNTSSGNKIFTCPSSIPAQTVSSMFDGTGGTFKGTPTAGNTYYWTE